MDIETFEKKLNELELTKKEFANMVGAVYNGVINWNAKGETPKWVDSWLINYEKAKVLDEISKSIKPFIK
ncbi:TPA: hypothetical protein ACJEZV_001090 [Campylobacter jejuni]|uniref:Uncharacterized protein n=4 Tax=Campylobacter TaxID=194 RepID=A0A381CGQ4_CAMCO|nr:MULTISPECIES: hypothetical protein [Campylobacter]EFC32485.1 hypothetical protein C414_000260164 [Campylobacter jejuni subsp. jejuni 414]OEW15305.1 hypothetical protein AJ935_01995 [Campylobacter sp. BCW_6876]AHK73190.1 acyl carrier protein [Campylobacter coli RM1875]EAB5248466.1 hypothetical protein [Campylobacter jejuni]EAH4836961.1 hypothetical protein [Campylobacter coli]